MAIKYAMMKHGKKMAQGGEAACEAHGTQMCEMCHGGEYAKGGAIEKEEVRAIVQPQGQYGNKVFDKMYDRRENKKSGPTGIHESKNDSKESHRKKLDELRSMKKPNLYAEGGFVDEEETSGYESMPEDRDKMNEGAMAEDNDMISRIMKQRYSKGGRVANDTPPVADFEDNQFDDLVKRDDLEQHYTGENSGDEIGNAQEDEDRRDIVARIMKSRRLKDRMPSPA